MVSLCTLVVGVVRKDDNGGWGRLGKDCVVVTWWVAAGVVVMCMSKSGYFC